MHPRPWAETVRSRSCRICMCSPCPHHGPANRSVRRSTWNRGRRAPGAMLPPVALSTRGPLTGYAAAALGGVVGALARWGVARALPSPAGGWPWATLLVNLTGCALIGFLLAVLLARFPTSPWLRPFLVTGVLGGYTTFSTFAVETVRLTDGGA